MIKIRKMKKSDIKVGDSVYWISGEGIADTGIIYVVESIIGDRITLVKYRDLSFELKYFIRVNDYK